MLHLLSALLAASSKTPHCLLARPQPSPRCHSLTQALAVCMPTRECSESCNVVQVLYDLGVVTTKEPFQRLVSQGMILGEVEYTAHRNPDGSWAAQEGPQTSAVR